MNRFIEFLVENQKKKVELSWNHLVAFPPPSVQGRGGIQGCYGATQGAQGVQGCYGAQGACGFTGAFSLQERNGKKYRKQFVPRTEMPEVLEFSIKFIDAKEQYKQFVELLCDVCPNVENSVRVTKTDPIPIARLRRLKAEVVPIFAEKNKEFEKRKAKVELLMDMAIQLGLRLEDEYWIDAGDSLSMPSDAYEEWGPQLETNAEIKIMCRKDTEIYKALDAANLLQTYSPEAYRRGDSYSVNGQVMHTQPTEEVLVE